MRIAFFELG